MGLTVGDAVYRLCRDRCGDRILMERLFQEGRISCEFNISHLINVMSDMV
jgi:hypothetical protein